MWKRRQEQFCAVIVIFEAICALYQAVLLPSVVSTSAYVTLILVDLFGLVFSARGMIIAFIKRHRKVSQPQEFSLGSTTSASHLAEVWDEKELHSSWMEDQLHKIVEICIAELIEAMMPMLVIMVEVWLYYLAPAGASFTQLRCQTHDTFVRSTLLKLFTVICQMPAFFAFGWFFGKADLVSTHPIPASQCKHSPCK